jgi:hypothetical protein
MSNESEGKMDEAAKLFLQSSSEATNDVEKFTTAQNVARQQSTVADKLK